MNSADLQVTLLWWGMLCVLSFAFLPLSFRLFPKFFDRGYIFAKTLAIILTTYVVFVAGVFHLITFTTLNTMLVVVVCAVIAHLQYFGFSGRNIRVNKAYFLSLWDLRKLIFFEEVLFLSVLLFWVYIRSFTPEIHGLEKYMDFGFVNSALRSTYFPPIDMWLPPDTINYYYFGHLATAVLTKLSGVPSYLTYNLMIATIAGLCFVSAFSIAVNLLVPLREKFVLTTKAVAGGILSALLVTFAGNLHILYAFFAPYENEHPVPIWTKAFQPLQFPNAYWYPNATRFIENTIHEFPIYSWVVSDLHGHVLDIPFVLLTLAVGFAMLQFFKVLPKPPAQTQAAGLGAFLHSLLLPLPYLVFAGFLLSVMYMTNAWDGIIYFLLFGFILLYFSWETLSDITNIVSRFIQAVIKAVSSVVVVGLSYIVFSLPFSVFFKPFVSGIGVLCAPKYLTDIGKVGPFLFEADHCSQSPLWQMAILYGFFLFFVISLLVFLRKRRHTISDVYVIIVIMLSTLLIIIPEFIYVKDIYPAHYRANTMFKLVFQSFMMLALVSGYTLSRILSTTVPTISAKSILAKLSFSVWFVISFVLITLVMLYPYLAIYSYYGDLKNYQGLNGLTYLKNLYPTDFAGIEWIQKNVSDQPVILEAQGDSYTDFARVSANTGLPTVLGWTVHEWLWRGTYDIPAPRIAEVETMYTSTDNEETRKLFQKHKVKYVFIGDLEYQKYPTLNEQKFEELGEKVFEEGKTKIYKL
jgi:uncharacterized membrane protein